MKRILYIALLLLSFLQVEGKGQTYPVSAFVNLTPPYSSYLPDYADPFNNQLRVLLTLNDFSIPSYTVKLRFRLEGSGYTIVNDNLLALPAFTLTPGVPIEISGNDLAPYLSSSNLSFTGIDVADYELRKVLPEGPCSICVEVVDFTNPNQAILGNPACVQAWFSLNDPPLLNMPFCGQEIPETDPQNIVFSWTPMSMGSPYGASTEYTFELFELRPEGADPNMTVTSTLPIYTSTTTNTLLNYGIIEPPLQLGMQYVWRVRAREIDGRNIYRNNGYSAVCTFTYGNIAASLADGITLELNAEGIGPRIGKAFWNTAAVFDGYRLEVRKTGNPDYAWFPYESATGMITVNSLEPETEYEARVQGLIGEDFESEWSNIATFTTYPPPNYACGSTALPGKQETIIPLTNLMVGNFVSFGQFDMQLTQVDPLGTPGHYKGYGKILVPFALTNFPVRFDDILVDENFMVREGRADALTDGLAEYINWLDREFINGIIDDIAVDTVAGTVTVTFGDETKTFTFPENGGPLVLEDESGLIFIINPDGTITYDGNINIDNDVLAATENYQIYFLGSEDQVFGFDRFDQPKWRNHYKTIILEDDYLYTIPFKSLGENETDQCKAVFRTSGDPSSASFETSTGTSIPFELVNDSTYLLTLSGLTEDAVIYGFNGEDKIGKLKVKVYEEKLQKITLIPLAGTTIGDLEAVINDIYIQANLRVEIQINPTYEGLEWDLNADGLMEAPQDLGLMTKYSTEMRVLRDTYLTDSIDRESVYLFVVPGFSAPDLDGYMVRGKGLGFIVSESSGHTLAHEVGHGAFSLQHTFDEIPQGTTTNLMDYAGISATRLTASQWDDMHNPPAAFSFLDDEEDGGLYKNGTHVTKICDPYVLAQINVRSLFYAPDGSLIDLESLPGAKANRFYDNQEKEAYAYGALNGFIYNGKQYVLAFNDALENPFVGYVEQIGIDKFSSTPIEIRVRDSVLNSAGVYVRIDCSIDSVRFFNNLGERESDRALYYDCDNCNFHNYAKYFVEGFPGLVDIYMSDKEEAGSGVFGSSGTLYSNVRDQINNPANWEYVDEFCEDRLKAFSLYNEGRQFKIIPYNVSFISRNEADWHLLAKTVFEASSLNEDDILITLPFHEIRVGNLNYIYFMPGLAYGHEVEFDEKILKGFQFDNMISAGDNAVRRNGNIVDFVNHVFTAVKKNLNVYEGTIYPNGEITYHTFSKENIAGFSQSNYIKLYQHISIPKSNAIINEYLFDNTLYSRDSNSHARKEINRRIFELLANTKPNEVETFVPEEENKFIFKDQFITKEIALEYIKLKAFDEFSISTNDSNLYSLPPAEYTWNKEKPLNFFDESIYGILDLTGIGLCFIGLDVITDGLGFVYANMRGHQENSMVYGASVFIIGVPSAGTKVAVELLESGTKTIVRSNGSELIVESFDEIIHSIRSELKVNGSLNNEEVLRIKELQDAGKLTPEKTSDFINASDNASLQRQILADIEEEISGMFSFLDELAEWHITLKQALKDDIEATPGLIKLFYEADLAKKLDLAEAWKFIRESIGNTTNNGFTKFAVDPKTLEKVSGMMKPGSGFRNAVGSNWDSKLGELIQKHKHLNCETCGGTFVSGPKMHDFLSDVEHFYTNFNSNGKASKYFNWLNRETAGLGEAADIATNNANTSLAEMYQTLYELRRRGLKEADINQFGASYSNLPNSRQSDILLNNGTHIELKNKKYTSGTTPTEQEIDQIIGVKGAFGNIDDLSKFEWVAFEARGNNLADLKTMWKNVFVNRADEIFEVNPELFKQFEKIGGGKIENLDDFETLLNHESFNIDHPMFNFIKCQ